MRTLLPLLAIIALAGCASQSPQMQDREASISPEQQRAAQQQYQDQQARLALKRKIAVGRISNETNYGRSLLRSGTDELGSKVSDMFVQSLTNSGNYLIFERPDINLLTQEAELTGAQVDMVGVDTLVIGSLTEFGRATTGEAGFLSSSKRQQATARVDLRLVDTASGRVFASVSGTGSSSTETANTMGFGSVASYDGSINDRAIGAAVNAAVEKLTQVMLERAWAADILALENGQLFISGGKSQGVQEGMEFAITTRGRKVKSTTTGATISLPGKQVARLKVEGTFGNTELEEGAYGTVIEGSIEGYALDDLQVRELANKEQAL